MTGLAPDGSERAAQRADPSTLTFLALFMLLLAFFILFNSVAIREAAKTEALIASLGAAFGRTNLPQPRQADPLALARDALRGELGALLARAAPDATAGPDQRNGALTAALPTARLFREELAELHSRSGPFLAGLADLLAQVRAEHRLTVEAILPAAPGDARAQGLALRRAGALARELVRLGAPQGAVAVGLSASTSERAEFVFRIEPRPAPSP